MKISRVGVNNSAVNGYTGYINFDSFELGEAYMCLTDPVQFTAARIFYSVQLDSKWHEYVVRVLANSTTSSFDGEFQLWVDGVSKGLVTGFNVSSVAGPMQEQWSCWGVKPYGQLNGVVTDGGLIYFDDFSTDTTYNSIYSSSTPSYVLRPAGLM